MATEQEEYDRIMAEHPERAERKARRKDHFAHAELAKDTLCQTRAYQKRNDGRLTDADWETLPAGTPVLITTVSRLGNLCFRRDRLDELVHGYECPAYPDHFKNTTKEDRDADRGR